MRFLIARLSSLGDVVCCLPTAFLLKSAFPECKITWVVDPRFKDVVDRCGAVDETISFRISKDLKSWPRLHDRFDAAFDLQGLLKSGLVIAINRSKLKYGYHWQREGSQLFSQKVIPDASSLHVVDQYLDVVRRAIIDLGGSVKEDLNFRMSPTASDLEYVENWRKDQNVNLPHVVLNPGAGWTTKRWPAESYSHLSHQVWQLGFVPVLIGGNSTADLNLEKEILESSAENKLQLPLSLVGKTSIGELIGLISTAKAHVGGDTGSTHIAANLSIPAIGLYSITRPERSCPYLQFSNTLYDPTGLSFITVEQVIDCVRMAIDADRLVAPAK